MDNVIRRKMQVSFDRQAEGGPGADRSWRLALARAARDQMALPLEVTRLSLSRKGLAEVLETIGELSFLAVLEGPDEGLGLMVVDQPVLAGIIEMLTVGRVLRHPVVPRRPTRTDAAMLVDLIDAALCGLEEQLSEEADLIWAGGFRYASFLDDPRPLGLLLEDQTYRVLSAEISLDQGGRQGTLVLALPADGRGLRPNTLTVTEAEEKGAGTAFSAALSEAIMLVEAQLEAVIARVKLPLGQISALQEGDLLPLPMASLDLVGLDSSTGQTVGQGRLGQNRGMRAVRLGEQEGARREARLTNMVDAETDVTEAFSLAQGEWG